MTEIEMKMDVDAFKALAEFFRDIPADGKLTIREEVHNNDMWDSTTIYFTVEYRNGNVSLTKQIKI